MTKFVVRVKLFWTFTEREYEDIADACKRFSGVCKTAKRDAEDGYCHPCVSLIKRTVDSNGKTLETIYFEKSY